MVRTGRQRRGAAICHAGPLYTKTLGAKVENVLLASICADEVAGLMSELSRLDRQEVAAQLSNVVVPSQALPGDSATFSFMAYPWPRLTQEQREKAVLRERESVSVVVGEGTVRLDLDEFGQINWFYVSGVPVMYRLLRSLNGHIGP